MKQEIPQRKSSLFDQTLNPNLKIKISSPHFCTQLCQNSPKSTSLLLAKYDEQSIFQHYDNQQHIPPINLMVKSSQFDSFPKNSINFHKNVNARKAIQVSKLQNISLENALFIVTKAIDECAAFHKSFGYSNFQIQNCVISGEGKLILTQTCPTLNFDKFTDETIVVIKIIEAISKICAPKLFNDFVAYFQRSRLNNICDFRYVRSLVHSYCLCSKLKMTSQFKISQAQRKQRRLCDQRQLKEAEKRITQSNRTKSSSRRIVAFEKSENESLTKFLSVHKNKNQIGTSKSLRSRKNDTHFSKQKKKFPKKMSKSNQISRQFSLKISFNCQSQAKDSLLSTNIQTPRNQQSFKKISEDMTLTLQNRFNSILSQNVPNSCQKSITPDKASKMTFYQVSLNQTSLVQCLTKNNELSNIKDGESPFAQDVLQHNEQKIYRNNNWIRRFNTLLIEDQPISQSLIIGNEGQLNQSPILDKLDKFARVLTDSYGTEENSRKKHHC